MIKSSKQKLINELTSNIQSRFPAESVSVISAFASLFNPKYYPDFVLNFGHSEHDILINLYGKPKEMQDGEIVQPWINGDDGGFQDQLIDKYNLKFQFIVIGSSSSTAS
jgi:hypothetical protein